LKAKLSPRLAAIAGSLVPAVVLEGIVEPVHRRESAVAGAE